MSVFVDTSAILAVFDANDPRHAEAAQLWTELMTSDEQALTSNYVIVETTALLHSRFGISGLRRFVEKMVPAMSAVWIDEMAHNTAVASVLAASGRHGPSIVDCASFDVIRKLGVTRVFAYDKHFADRGYVSFKS